MRHLVLLFCGILMLALAGCGGDAGIDEAPYSDIPLVDSEGNELESADAERLFEAAHDYLNSNEPENAFRLYAEVQARFPFSSYATQAALESITAQYLLDEYNTAVSAADRFIKQHPRHPHIDYVYYLRGLANYNRNQSGFFTGNADKRDLSYLRQAFADFKLLIRNFPDSVYANDAQQHMIEIRNRLADFELGVAEYYLHRHAYVASARRAAYIVNHYQRSAAVPRALEIMQQSYINLGLPGLAEDARAILQASYPGYILHREEFYRQRAGQEPRYDLPPLDETGGAETGGDSTSAD